MRPYLTSKLLQGRRTGQRICKKTKVRSSHPEKPPSKTKGTGFPVPSELGTRGRERPRDGRADRGAKRPPWGLAEPATDAAGGPPEGVAASRARPRAQIYTHKHVYGTGRVKSR